MASGTSDWTGEGKRERKRENEADCCDQWDIRCGSREEERENEEKST